MQRRRDASQPEVNPCPLPVAGLRRQNLPLELKSLNANRK